MDLIGIDCYFHVMFQIAADALKGLDFFIGRYLTVRDDKSRITLVLCIVFLFSHMDSLS
jgi:hypothetical protein